MIKISSKHQKKSSNYLFNRFVEHRHMWEEAFNDQNEIVFPCFQLFWMWPYNDHILDVVIQNVVIDRILTEFSKYLWPQLRKQFLTKLVVKFVICGTFGFP